MAVWTESRTEILKKLWAEGLTTSLIALELGGISRNAVIGRAHRLKLVPRAKAPAKGKRRRRPKRIPHDQRQILNGIKRAANRKSIEGPPMQPEQVQEPEVIEIEIPTAQRCTLFELTDSTCRYPIGDVGTADFYFCGARPAKGLPYCGFHSRMCFNPPGRRDKRAVVN